MPETLGPIPKRAARQREAELRQAFWKEVAEMPHGERIKNCIQCGTCTGTCPVSYAMDITPRQTVALFRAGHIHDILHSRTIWVCASCYSCTVRCPQDIKVTDMLYALKRLAMVKKIYPDKFPVYALSQAFTENLYKYGRNFELGLGAHYFLKTNPMKMVASAGFGLAMMKRGRMSIRPTTIRKVQEIRAIIDRANQIEGV
ncbi:MAG: 4Fe-4S dicluster domain-containing protein [Calditrichota bacterium]